MFLFSCLGEIRPLGEVNSKCVFHLVQKDTLFVNTVFINTVLHYGKLSLLYSFWGKGSVVQILVKTELEQNLAIDIFLCEALLTWIMKTMWDMWDMWDMITEVTNRACAGTQTSLVKGVEVLGFSCFRKWWLCSPENRCNG